MATNPRIPDRHDVPTLKEQAREKKPGSPLVPLGILVAALLLIALIVWLPRTPKASVPPSGAVIPAQPTGNQVQLTDLRISPAPVGNQIYIYGKLFNSGETTINGLNARVTFSGQNNQPLNTITSAVQAVENGVGKNLVEMPIKPNDTRDIRINIEHVPQGWNHQIPEIAVERVTAQGGR
jgi:hypothetical protein